VNAAGNHWLDEDRVDIPSPVESIAAQGQPRPLQFADMGYYNMTNDQPPQHEHRDPAINNYAAVTLDLPGQAQATPPAPVCADFTFPHTYI
jgi:hypothetical protein